MSASEKENGEERSFTRFVGVDLGGGKGKKTALAVIEARQGEGAALVVEIGPRDGAPPWYDASLLARLRAESGATALCVDAPLTLPPCLRCTVPVCPGQDRCVDPSVIEMRGLHGEGGGASRDGRRGKPGVTPYTQRVTDVYLHRRRGLLPRETLGQGMGPLAARAAHLVRALADRFILDVNLIEVYPKATLALLGFRDAYKKHVDRRIDILARLPDLRFAPGVWREECRKSDHAFDAVIAAYTGYLWCRDGWEIPADAVGARGGDGWIWVPPESASAGAAGAEPETDREALPAPVRRGVG